MFKQSLEPTLSKEVKTHCPFLGKFAKNRSNGEILLRNAFIQMQKVAYCLQCD